MQDESQRLEDLLQQLEVQGKRVGWLIGLLALPIFAEVLVIANHFSAGFDPNWVVLLLVPFTAVNWYRYRKKQQDARGKPSTSECILEIESKLRRLKQMGIGAVIVLVALFAVLVLLGKSTPPTS